MINPPRITEEHFKMLKIDLEALEADAKSSIERQSWAACPRLVANFNRLLEAAGCLGVSQVEPIEPVPEDQRGYLGISGSDAEKDKLSEIATQTSRLLNRLNAKIPGQSQNSAQTDPVATLKRLCESFHAFVLKLATRREKRPPLVVDDEYDAQYLIYALLTLFFDDIRPEEYTPSSGGKSTRMDFLMKTETVVLEVKVAREGHTDKEIADELYADIGRYPAHPACKTLVCFVYDPDQVMKNPVGFERDLTKQIDRFRVHAFVFPKA
jgi:hypothetical protein